MPVSIKFIDALINQNITISGDYNMPHYCEYTCNGFVLTACSFERHNGYRWHYLALVGSQSAHFTVTFQSCVETSWHYGLFLFYFYADCYFVMGIQKNLPVVLYII
jgi:hypothetical protein